MKKFISGICLSFVLAGPAFCAPPSDASLRQLMALTEMKQMVTGVFGQFDNMMNGFIGQSLKGQQVTEAQQTAINNLKAKMVELLKSEYKWETLEPQFRQIYKDTFTQEEVNGMIVFYKSPAGKAVTKKMPAVIQQSMMASQSMVQALMPKMQQIQQEFAAEMEAAKPEQKKETEQK